MLGSVIGQTGLEEILGKLKGYWDEERRGCAGAEKEGTHEGHRHALLIYSERSHSSISHHR